ncbi:hypothetical protein VNO77_04240 [Canavalia gladiata]|uniref:Uncharacterized protein n=1 Tax=Canavalia gladiata TaxID=3824 RepID=A0AAN9N1B6_CANGL
MDAMRFLTTVKDTFQDQVGKFDEFCEVMNNFKAHRIGVVEVRSRAMDIFEGHRDLILEFNKFLPKRYEISLPSENEQPSQKTSIEFQDAMNFVNKIKVKTWLNLRSHSKSDLLHHNLHSVLSLD